MLRIHFYIWQALERNTLQTLIPIPNLYLFKIWSSNWCGQRKQHSVSHLFHSKVSQHKTPIAVQTVASWYLSSIWATAHLFENDFRKSRFFGTSLAYNSVFFRLLLLLLSIEKQCYFVYLFDLFTYFGKWRKFVRRFWWKFMYLCQISHISVKILLDINLLRTASSVIFYSCILCFFFFFLNGDLSKTSRSNSNYAVCRITELIKGVRASYFFFFLYCY